MHGGPTLLRNQGVGRLLDPVVQEPVGFPEAQDQSGSHDLCQTGVCSLRAEYHFRRCGRGGCSQTCQLRERCLYSGREPLDSADHEVYDIVGKALGADLGEVPSPLPCGAVQIDQAFFLEGTKELNRKEGVSTGLFMDQLGERCYLVRVLIQRIAEEPCQVLRRQRTEYHVRDLYTRLLGFL